MQPASACRLAPIPLCSETHPMPQSRGFWRRGEAHATSNNFDKPGVTSGRSVNCRVGMLLFPLVCHSLGLENLCCVQFDLDRSPFFRCQLMKTTCKPECS